MRVVIQRVSTATVSANQKKVAEISNGLTVLVGIEEADNELDANWLAKKIGALRIFPDDDGVMNLSIKDINGQMLVISQFTLHALTRKGNRPSFIKAAPPGKALALYQFFIDALRGQDLDVTTGIFGADMSINLCNEGPVTILMDSKNRE